MLVGNMMINHSKSIGHGYTCIPYLRTQPQSYSSVDLKQFCLEMFIDVASFKQMFDRVSNVSLTLIKPKLGFKSMVSMIMSSFMALDTLWNRAVRDSPPNYSSEKSGDDEFFTLW